METLRGPRVTDENADFNISALTRAGEIGRCNKGGLTVNNHGLSVHHSRRGVVNSETARIMPQFWSTLTRPMHCSQCVEEVDWVRHTALLCHPTTAGCHYTSPEDAPRARQLRAYFGCNHIRRRSKFQRDPHS